MNLFSERKFISAKTGKGLKYLYYSPNTDGNLPLIIYLHGAGSRGAELSQMSHAGPIGELEKGRKIPAKIAAPQCCGDTWFELFETLIDFAENTANESGVDKSRIYLTGGARTTASRRPARVSSRFARPEPASAGGRAHFPRTRPRLRGPDAGRSGNPRGPGRRTRP